MRNLTVAFSIVLPIILIIGTISILSIPQNMLYSYSSMAENGPTSITILNTTDSISSPTLKFENVKTIPDKIHVGEKFSINATVINTGFYPVTFVANLCDSELYATFDNKVGELNAPECKMVSKPVTLNAGDKTIVQRISDLSGITYKALKEGESKANAFLPYTINISDDLSIDSHLKNTFTITISPNSF